MTPKPDVSAERRQQIYQAALTCFDRKGYHLTTMDDIVVESGLSKGALYWYFKGKKEIFLSLIQEMLAQLGQEWERIISNLDTTPTQKLNATLDLFRNELEGAAPFFGLMMETWAQTRHDPDVENITRELYEPYLSMMTRIIDAGVASGEFQAKANSATALVVMTIFDGLTMLMGLGLWDIDWNEIMDAAEMIVLKGLGVRDA